MSIKNESLPVPALTSGELQDAGINATITQNDLVEVIAYDVYEKYYESVMSAMKEGKKLDDEAETIFNAEFEKMKKELTVAGHLEETDASDINTSVKSAPGEKYWDGTVFRHSLRIEEKDRGTFVYLSTDANNRFSSPGKKYGSKVTVQLTIKVCDKEETKDISISKTGITGNITKTINKEFTKIVTVPLTKFTEMRERILEYNTRLKDLASFLPKNGQLSVERFARDARVKINKSILSNQSKTFRDKMEKLFGVQF